MPQITKRPGLSFELASATRAHPNRTDIACFVGTVERRPASASVLPVPEPLARWLEDGGIGRIGGAPVRTLRVDFKSAASAVASLLARAPAAQSESLKNLLAGSSQEHLKTFLEACGSLAAVPAGVIEDLRLRSYYPGGLLGNDALAAWTRIQRLDNLPVAVDTFEQFDALFAWEARGIVARLPRGDAPRVVTPLGAAVRAFFAEGGRRCFVVRTADPNALFEPAAERFKAIPGTGTGANGLDIQLRGVSARIMLGLLAEVRGADADDPLDPVSTNGADWRGIEHVFGLAEVSLLCLPDLVDACAQDIPKIIPPAEVLAVPERFRECADEPVPVVPQAGRRLPSPRLTSAGLLAWRKLLAHAARVLDNGSRAHNRRDIQIVASLPIPGSGREMPSGEDWLEWMSETDGYIDNARIQLGYPWLHTRDSADCQGGVEAPEGTLTGILARSALQRGSYRLAAGQPLARYISGEPSLSLERALREETDTAYGRMTFAERVCLMGATPRGPRLLSDVTLARDPLLRPGSVRRLINVVLHATREIGDEMAFETNGDQTWTQVRARLGDLGRDLLAAGALHAEAPGGAFVVRCGRETMSQVDLDAGRLIAEIELAPAQPITRIVIVLALRDAQPLIDLRSAA